MNADHYAKEAQRLLDDETLKYALDALKTDALDALVSADVDDKTLVLRLQQKVQLINEIRSELSNAVSRAKPATSPAGTIA